MKDTPIDFNIVTSKIEELGITDFNKATIRDIVKLANRIEAATGQKYIRMEMGVPGLDPSEIGVNAEIEALKKGVASVYPMLEGVDILKQEASRFIKLFMNIDIPAEVCIPTTGSMQGSLCAFLVGGRAVKEKDTILFIDPGFPVQKQQVNILGLKYASFDVYNYRGTALREKLESILSQGNISMIVYSNPNNPSWICFSENELRIIGEMAEKYDIIVMEDLAYFSMDFRRDLYTPGQPPYQVSVANYTDKYILLISSSKVFSYAGQRIGILAGSPAVMDRKYPDLLRFYNFDTFGYALVSGTLYALSAGVTHSSQYALASMLKAANDGEYNYIEVVKEYGERAKIMKEIFVENGFQIVYDKDEDQPLADGFYFTLSYHGFTGNELIKELLYYGISAISLISTGSERTEGLRACVSHVHRSQFDDLKYRLQRFREDHSGEQE